MAKRSPNRVLPPGLGEVSVPQLSELMAQLPEDRVVQLFEALLDLATGHRLFVPGKKVPNGAVGTPDEAWIDGVEGMVYTLRPDSAAIKLLLEHNIGRPATKAVAPQDQQIQVLHCVPGKRNWRADDDGEVQVVGGIDEPVPAAIQLEAATLYDPTRDVEFIIP